jgi:hypothetical protein
MASQAHFIVERRILHSGFVDVMARYAGESRLAISPAATLFETVCRKSQVKNPGYETEADIGRSTVTSPAEIHRVSRAEARRVENERRSRRIMFQAHLRNMLRSWAMTCFTGDAGNHSVGVKYAVCACGRGMAAKAQRRLVWRHAPAERSLDAVRPKLRPSGGEV